MPFSNGSLPYSPPASDDPDLIVVIDAWPSHSQTRCFGVTAMVKTALSDALKWHRYAALSPL